MKRNVSRDDASTSLVTAAPSPGMTLCRGPAEEDVVLEVRLRLRSGSLGRRRNSQVDLDGLGAVGAAERPGGLHGGEARRAPAGRRLGEADRLEHLPLGQGAPVVGGEAGQLVLIDPPGKQED